jgi:membrane-bound lytic murein transglycosylase B
MITLLACAVAAAVASPPAPNARIPHNPRVLAATIATNEHGLAQALGRWNGRARPPREVTLYALYEQRIDRLLARSPRLYDRTLRRLPPTLQPTIRDPVRARRELDAITPISPLRRIRTGRALPPRVLLRYYREAQRRFHVAWNVLAAVNFVETAFNKVRNSSATGAQGPMQFMPSTWRAYGLGGDIHDPHDAILGAANYLHASGAPRNYARALHAYNPSWLYVDAVSRYARRMRLDPQAYFRFYSWQVIVRTRHGDRRLTGPGR